MESDISSFSVLMADDHLVVAHGVQKLLKSYVQQIDVVPTGEALLEAMGHELPDIVLLDIGLPGISGIEALERLRQFSATVPVVMLSMHTELGVVQSALAAGATGYVVKQASGEELLTAIECAIRGEMFISPSVDFRGRARSASQGFVPSPAQLAVLRLAANGLRATQIAVELGLSRRTVESHKYLMMQQLELTTTIQLVSWAVDEGYV